MNVLVTGGAGYIGSHAALHLLRAGHAVTVLDDLSRGHRAAVDALGGVELVEADVGDVAAVRSVLRRRGVEAVMHFAALAYVGESMQEPLRYHRVNAAGTLALLEAVDASDVRRLVLSSSCAVYGAPGADDIPIVEMCPLRPVNPYGRSKLAAERAVFDFAAARAERTGDFAAAALRYFNVAGCDRGGRLGEEHDPETHLVPVRLDAAIGRRGGIAVFGTDYDTPDGTCIRDYVDVEDLADAHAAVLAALRPGDARVYNVGTGRGHSVREVVEVCRKVTGADIPLREEARRPGDPPVLQSDPSRIAKEIGWRAKHADLQEIVASAWAYWKRRKS